MSGNLDELRDKLKILGIEVKDTENGQELKTFND